MYIAPRITRESRELYDNNKEILTHLRGVFANPNRAAEVYAQYYNLIMKPKENFNDFYAKFSRLVEEANIPMLYRKRDLYSKLLYLL